MDKTEELLPTQADRNFAADYLRARGKVTDRDHERICQGLWDETDDVLDVTRHRLQSSARGGEVERLREALEALVAKASGPNGWDWMFPLRVKPVDGKPTIVSHKGGNLFRGYIGTWNEADLLVALANAAPQILTALESLPTSNAAADGARVDAGEISADHRAHAIFDQWDRHPDAPAYWFRLPSWVQAYATECVAATERRLATHPVEGLTGERRDDYRGWQIEHNPPPIPCRDFDFTATHPGFDGEGDTRQVWGRNLDAIYREIDGWYEENGL